MGRPVEPSPPRVEWYPVGERPAEYDQPSFPPSAIQDWANGGGVSTDRLIAEMQGWLEFWEAGQPRPPMWRVEVYTRSQSVAQGLVNQAMASGHTEYAHAEEKDMS